MTFSLYHSLEASGKLLASDFHQVIKVFGFNVEGEIFSRYCHSILSALLARAKGLVILDLGELLDLGNQPGVFSSSEIFFVVVCPQFKEAELVGGEVEIFTV